jgi:uncharacterized protein
MNFEVLECNYAIYKFGIASLLPDWIYSSGFYSITKTKDEISVVAAQNEIISSDFVCNKDWRVIKIEGSLDFSLVGIIADISAIFKRKKISVFTLSTYDTDYFLVKQKDLDIAIQALLENDHKVSTQKKKASE